MGDAQTTSNGIESRLKTADAYESHGLFDEALALYQEVLAELPEDDADRRSEIQKKIDGLKEEVEDDEGDAGYELSSEEVTHIKSGLSIGESGPEIFDSATAFRELGLYKEAVSEYQKLFQTDFSIDDFLQDFLDCLLSVYPPGEACEEIERIVRENQLEQQTEAAIKFGLGHELDQRDYKELATRCYEGVQKINPVYPKLKEHLEAVQPERRFESRYDYLLKNEIVSTAQLQKALPMAKKMKKSVEHVLMEQFKVSKEDIGKSLSAYYNCPFRTFDPKMEVPYELISNLKKPFLLQDLWVPLHWEVGHIEILMDDPKDLRKLDHAKALFNTNKFIFSVGIKEDIEAIINHFFSEKKTQTAHQKSGRTSEDALADMPDIAFEEDEEDEGEGEEDYDEGSGKSSGWLIRCSFPPIARMPRIFTLSRPR